MVEGLCRGPQSGRLIDQVEQTRSSVSAGDTTTPLSSAIRKESCFHFCWGLFVNLEIKSSLVSVLDTISYFVRLGHLCNCFHDNVTLVQVLVLLYLCCCEHTDSLFLKFAQIRTCVSLLMDLMMQGCGPRSCD